MKSALPDPYSEILSLQLRLKHPLSFGCDSDQLYAERSDTATRLPITEWQMQLLLGMNSDSCLGDLLYESGFKIDREFSRASLLAFCTMLAKNGVLSSNSAPTPASEPILENSNDGQDESPNQAPKNSQFSSAVKQLFANRDQAIKIACYALTFIGVLRLAWVVAPVFEPVMERIEMEITEGGQREQVQRTPEMNQLPTLAERGPQEAKVESVAISGKSKQIKRLREQLAACRIRRDEYYLQSNENGYRRELEAMTSLTRKIGELKTAE